MTDLPDGWRDRFNELDRRATNTRFDQIVTSQTWPGELPSSGPRVPPPGECHPFYAGNGFLRGWINNPDAGQWVRVLKPRSLTIPEMSTDGPPDVSQDTITLTRRRCYGAAPYVGRPFVYTWDVVVDGLGRAVAGDDVRIRYTDPADGVVR